MDVPNHLRYLDVSPMLFVSTVVVGVAVVGAVVLGVGEDGVAVNWPVVGVLALVATLAVGTVARRR